MTKSTLIKNIPDETWKQFKSQVPKNTPINVFINGIIEDIARDGMYNRVEKKDPEQNA